MPTPDGGITSGLTGVDWQEGDVLDPVSLFRRQRNPGSLDFTPGVFLLFLSGGIAQPLKGVD